MGNDNQSVENIRKPWVSTAYYANAEKWTFPFWEEARPFRKMF